MVECQADRSPVLYNSILTRIYRKQGVVNNYDEDEMPSSYAGPTSCAAAAAPVHQAMRTLAPEIDPCCFRRSSSWTVHGLDVHLNYDEEWPRMGPVDSSHINVKFTCF
jgi:hypothetical protein